jgi:hypothetical protein
MHIFNLEKKNIYDLFDSLFKTENSGYVKTDVAKDDWETPIKSNGQIVKRIYADSTNPGPEFELYLYLPLESAISSSLYSKFSKELERISEEENKKKGHQIYSRDVKSYENVFCIKITCRIHAGATSARITYTSGLAQLWHLKAIPTDYWARDEIRNFVPTKIDFSYAYTVELPEFNQFVDCGFKHTTYGAIEIVTTNRIAEREVTCLLESGQTDDYYEYGDYLQKMFKFI